MMDTSKYITKIYSYNDSKLKSPLETLAEIDYSMGYMDFFFKKSDNTVNHTAKIWLIKTSIDEAIKNGENNLKQFKNRYEKNIKDGLYLDDKCQKEIKSFFSFMEEKINKLKEYNITDIVAADLSDYLFMYNYSEDVPVGENEIKQRKYLNNLIDGAFSEKLESEELSIAKKKIADLNNILLKQEKILYIDKDKEIYIPIHFNLGEKLMFKFFMDVTVYNKPLSLSVHMKMIEDVFKSVRSIFNSRGFDFELEKDIPQELLDSGKIRLIVYGIQDIV